MPSDCFHLNLRVEFINRKMNFKFRLKKLFIDQHVMIWLYFNLYRVKNNVTFTYGFCFCMDYNNVSFFVKSCKLLFENKLSWIFYQLIYFHDNKKNYFLDNLYTIIKLITLFICYEYKATMKQLIISSNHFLIITFSKIRQ